MPIIKEITAMVVNNRQDAVQAADKNFLAKAGWVVTSMLKKDYSEAKLKAIKEYEARLTIVKENYPISFDEVLTISQELTDLAEMLEAE